LLFQTPIDGISWDIMAFQLYRSLFDDKASGTLTQFFVYDYATSIKNTIGPLFPNAEISADIGLVDAGPVYPATLWANAGELKKDVEAARTAGVQRRNISVYSLKGMYAPSGSVWFAQNPLDGQPVPPGDGITGTASLHVLYHTADALGFVFAN
jgi:hypothetical protein